MTLATSDNNTMNKLGGDEESSSFSDVEISSPKPEQESSTELDIPSGEADPSSTEEEEALTLEEQAQAKRDRTKKIVLAVLLVGLIAYVIADSLTARHIASALDDFLEWIEENPTSGFFAFIVVYFIATILWIPGAILTLGAGFVFGSAFGVGPGVLLGSLSVFIGASLGSIAAFLMARYFFRDAVGRLSTKYATFQALDRAFESKGLRIMILLRLSPIIPFNAINYVAGVTTLKFWHFVIALIAILPGTALYVFLGASAGSLMETDMSSNDSTVTIIVVVVGIVFGVAAIALTSYYAKKELNKLSEDMDQDEGDNNDEENNQSNEINDEGKDEETGEASSSDDQSQHDE